MQDLFAPITLGLWPGLWASASYYSPTTAPPILYVHRGPGQRLGVTMNGQKNLFSAQKSSNMNIKR